MRIVDVTQWYSPTSGGIRTYLAAKARWASSKGLDHALVVPAEASGEGSLDGSRLVRVRGRTPTESWGYRMVLRPQAVLAALDRLAPGVVVLHDVTAFPRAVVRWAAARGVGVAMMCHSDMALAARALPRVLARPVGSALGWMQRRGTGAPALVFVTSRACEDRVAPHVRGRVERLPLGVDLGVFGTARPDGALRDTLCRVDEPLLLYAGRLSREKCVDLLPEVLVRLRDGHLVVAGSGPAETAVRRRAMRLGVAGRMTFLGHIDDRSRLARLMATSDCFVHPNPEEPFGLAPLEALAAGCRVVAPSAIGCGDILAARGGVLVSRGTAWDLADGVIRALGRPRPTPSFSGLGWDSTFRREWALYDELAGAA